MEYHSDLQNINTPSTEQEDFWAGEFGNAYVERNKNENYVADNLAFFSKVIARTQRVNKILELGANVGLNLMTLKHLLPNAEFSAVEINEKAALALKRNVPDVDIYQKSIVDFTSNEVWDFIFTKGVLIHINPDQLPKVYELMYQKSSRYILIAEYYNQTPTEVSYRGHSGKLFKRDFAGEMLKKFPDLSLVDYGFIYRGDTNFPQDDITWFLLEK
ncbi:pseudaminic acid biosynthesis-associated methylase [Aeromonas allosaccharophila]|uniref:pseudaminic acid biosynthesis-associated methylase n=1 Tax=Aeromonas allosaccharophila TaxID=656 RepID=UPI003007247C